MDRIKAISNLLCRILTCFNQNDNLASMGKDKRARISSREITEPKIFEEILVGLLNESRGIKLISSIVVIFILLSCSVIAADADKEQKESLLLRYAESVNRIKTITLHEEISSVNSHNNGKSESRDAAWVVSYSQKEGKIRRESVGIDNKKEPITIENEKKVHMASGAIPGFEVIDSLLKSALNGKVKIGKKNDSIYADKYIGKRKPRVLLSRIEFDVNGLPINYQSYGANGKLMDDCTIKWNKYDGVMFPASIETIQYSKNNKSQIRISNTAIKINIPLASSVFEEP